MTSWKEFSREKIIHPQHLLSTTLQLREQGKTLATLNGAFDLLHAGHMYMLYEASQVADILLVAVNSDASVQAYKGSNRPIVPLSYRMEMLTAITFVDYVTWFDESDPRTLLEIVQPDIHVNGVEYGMDCIEADVIKKHGGRLHLVDRLPELSTSDLIKKIEGLLCV